MAKYRVSSGLHTALLLVGLFIAGCGSDGSDGADGADGSPGPAGPPGPGSGVPITSAEKINVAITGVVVPAGGGAPTVQLTLRNDLNQGLVGLPVSVFKQMEQT
jgi:hypothetical protein